LARFLSDQHRCAANYKKLDDGGPAPRAAGWSCAWRGSSPVRGHEARGFTRCPGSFEVKRWGCGCPACDRPGQNSVKTPRCATQCGRARPGWHKNMPFDFPIPAAKSPQVHCRKRKSTHERPCRNAIFPARLTHTTPHRTDKMPWHRPAIAPRRSRQPENGRCHRPTSRTHRRCRHWRDVHRWRAHGAVARRTVAAFPFTKRASPAPAYPAVGDRNLRQPIFQWPAAREVHLAGVPPNRRLGWRAFFCQPTMQHSLGGHFIPQRRFDGLQMLRTFGQHEYLAALVVGLLDFACNCPGTIRINSKVPKHILNTHICRQIISRLVCGVTEKSCGALLGSKDTASIVTRGAATSRAAHPARHTPP